MGFYHQNFEDMIEMDVCPVCKSDLYVKKQVERHGDDMSYNEYITKKYCPSHGDMDELDYEDMEEEYAD